MVTQWGLIGNPEDRHQSVGGGKVWGRQLYGWQLYDRGTVSILTVLCWRGWGGVGRVGVVGCLSCSLYKSYDCAWYPGLPRGGVERGGVGYGAVYFVLYIYICYDCAWYTGLPIIHKGIYTSEHVKLYHTTYKQATHIRTGTRGMLHNFRSWNTGSFGF